MLFRSRACRREVRHAVVQGTLELVVLRALAAGGELHGFGILDWIRATTDDQLVVEEKGIYSIENFLNARRLMYWQVYLHKTTVSAERMLVNLMRRAQALTRAGCKVHATSSMVTLMRWVEEGKGEEGEPLRVPPIRIEVRVPEETQTDYARGTTVDRFVDRLRRRHNFSGDSAL